MVALAGTHPWDGGGGQDAAAILPPGRVTCNVFTSNGGSGGGGFLVSFPLPGLAKFCTGGGGGGRMVLESILFLLRFSSFDGLRTLTGATCGCCWRSRPGLFIDVGRWFHCWCPYFPAFFVREWGGQLRIAV